MHSWVLRVKKLRAPRPSNRFLHFPSPSEGSLPTVWFAQNRVLLQKGGWWEPFREQLLTGAPRTRLFHTQKADLIAHL